MLFFRDCLMLRDAAPNWNSLHFLVYANPPFPMQSGGASSRLIGSTFCKRPKGSGRLGSCPALCRNMKTLESRHSCCTFILTALFLLLLSHTALAWPGLVVGISDGDTITVLRDGREQVKIRLYGIDCPEKRQAWGNRSTQATRLLCAGKMVEVQETGSDRYGRTVAILILPTGRILQKELVAEGLAWVWPKYCKLPICLEWSETETQARENKVGLWQDAEPVPPWEWRAARPVGRNRMY